MADNLELEEPTGGQGSSEEQQPILGRFKSQADLENAYRESEGRLTQTSQELADLKRTVEELRQKSVVPPVEVEEEDLDQQFFREPAKATERVIRSAISPIFEFLYEQQKVPFRSDPEFVKHEREVDQLIAMQPQLKMQPGVVGQVFKMVQGLHFDPVEFRKKVLEEQQQASKEKIEGGLESSSPSEEPGKRKVSVNLTDDEKRIALKFNLGATKEEAYKRYAEMKAKSGKV